MNEFSKMTAAIAFRSRITLAAAVFIVIFQKNVLGILFS